MNQHRETLFLATDIDQGPIPAAGPARMAFLARCFAEQRAIRRGPRAAGRECGVENAG